MNDDKCDNNHNQIIKLNEWMAVAKGKSDILKKFAERRSCPECAKIINEEWVHLLDKKAEEYANLLMKLL